LNLGIFLPQRVNGEAETQVLLADADKPTPEARQAHEYFVSRFFAVFGVFSMKNGR